jgi:hypothetical protein
MSMNLTELLAGTIAEHPDAALSPASGVDSGTTMEPVVRPAVVHTPVVSPHDPAPLDWSQAVDAAAARLEESWVRPDVTGYMLASGLADEFAATLCAYGMMTAEVAHMHEHIDERSRDGKAPPV